MIAIIDYGMGNLMSVEKALNHLGFPTIVTNDKNVIQSADKIVLPGVGAFGDAMREIQNRNLVEVLQNEVASGKPFLGICLGLQVLFESSEEAPGVEGLSIIPGKVVRFVTDLKVPHMGWNSLIVKKPSKILEGIEPNAFVYFVHSYYVVPNDENVIATTTDYDGEFVSSVSMGNLFAMQFHPEKSQKIGLKMLENFGKM